MLKTSYLSETLLRAGGKGVLGALGGAGRFIRKHPTGSLATAGAVGFAGPEVASGFRRGAQSVSPDYIRAQRAGYLAPPQPAAGWPQLLQRY